MKKILISVLVVLMMAAMTATAQAASLADTITPGDEKWEAYLDAHPEAFAIAPSRSATMPRTAQYPVTITKKLVGIKPEALPDGTVFKYVLLDGNAGDQGLPFLQITKQDLIAGKGEYSLAAYSKYDEVFVKEFYSGTEIPHYYCEISATVEPRFWPSWEAGFVDHDNGFVAPPMKLVNADGSFNNAEVIISNTYEKIPELTIPQEPGKHPVTIMKKLAGIEPDHLPDGTVFRFRVFDGNGVDAGITAEITKEELIAGNGTAYKTVLTEHSYVFVGEEKGVRIPSYGNGETAVFLPNKFRKLLNQQLDIKNYVVSPLITLIDKNNQINKAFVGFINTYDKREIESAANMPKTGDESDILLWAVMLLASGAAGVILLSRKREA